MTLCSLIEHRNLMDLSIFKMTFSAVKLFLHSGRRSLWQKAWVTSAGSSTYQAVDLQVNLKGAGDLRPGGGGGGVGGGVSWQTNRPTCPPGVCVWTHRVNLVGKLKVSPVRPRWVLARGVATVVSAPARIRMKNEYLVDSVDRQQYFSPGSTSTAVQQLLTDDRRTIWKTTKYLYAMLSKLHGAFNSKDRIGIWKKKSASTGTL